MVASTSRCRLPHPGSLQKAGIGAFRDCLGARSDALPIAPRWCILREEKRNTRADGPADPRRSSRSQDSGARRDASVWDRGRAKRSAAGRRKPRTRCARRSGCCVREEGTGGGAATSSTRAACETNGTRGIVGLSRGLRVIVLCVRRSLSRTTQECRQRSRESSLNGMFDHKYLPADAKLHEPTQACACRAGQLELTLLT